MAEIKWIKIVTDIFDDEKILLIESLPDGDSIIVCWFKLLCLAGKQNNSGVLMLSDRVAYTEEMLATVFRRPIQTVRLALETFEQFGMVEIINGAITIPNWGKHQNIEGIEKVRGQTRERVGRYRERQKLLLSSGVCQYCGQPATGEDHIIPLARGGSDTEDNKVPCCIRCNRIKNDKPLIDFLNNNFEMINHEIVAKNEKLSRYVTLRNVTERYIVTDGNATEEEKNKNKKKNKSKSVFVPPTLEEVKAYVAEKGYSVDAEYFYKYYSTGEWIDSKGNPVRNWKQKLITWAKKDEEKPVKSSPNSKGDFKPNQTIDKSKIEQIRREFGI
jgi:predicted phage replisome organizer